MEFVVPFILCGITAAVIGSKKSSGGTGFLLGLFLGPFGILIAIFMRGNQKQCPACAELVHPDAKICKHCGQNLDVVACPHCNATFYNDPNLKGEMGACPQCSKEFTY